MSITARAERDRRYREKNREALAARRRQRSAGPEFRERERERNRRYRQQNRQVLAEKRRESDRDRGYREENREVIAQRRRESDPDRDRRYRQQQGPVREAERRARYTHGPNAAEVMAAMWEQQGGCCYLCGDALTREKAVVDHDHACCPKAKTCDACRRGFACQRCNRLIGMVDDDVMLLRRIAGNLGVALDLYRDRVAAKPMQLDILPEAS